MLCLILIHGLNTTSCIVLHLNIIVFAGLSISIMVVFKTCMLIYLELSRHGHSRCQHRRRVHVSVRNSRDILERRTESCVFTLEYRSVSLTTTLNMYYN